MLVIREDVVCRAHGAVEIVSGLAVGDVDDVHDPFSSSIRELRPAVCYPSAIQVGEMLIDYPTPELRTDRIVLRKWSMGDLACVQAASQAGYSRGSTIPIRYTEDEGRAWVERQWARQEADDGLSMAIAKVDTGEAIGMAYIGLRGIEGHGALGYWLVPQEHRRGYGSEAVKLISRWVLRETDIYRVVAYVEPANEASIALLRKCGFTEEGTLRSFLPFEDGPADVLSFSLVATDLTDRT